MDRMTKADRRPALGLIGPLYIYTIMHVYSKRIKSIKQQISGQIELSNVSFETGNRTRSYNIIRQFIDYILITRFVKQFLTRSEITCTLANLSELPRV